MRNVDVWNICLCEINMSACDTSAHSTCWHSQTHKHGHIQHYSGIKINRHFIPWINFRSLKWWTLWMVLWNVHGHDGIFSLRKRLGFSIYLSLYIYIHIIWYAYAESMLMCEWWMYTCHRCIRTVRSTHTHTSHKHFIILWLYVYSMAMKYIICTLVEFWLLLLSQLTRASCHTTSQCMPLIDT